MNAPDGVQIANAPDAVFAPPAAELASASSDPLGLQHRIEELEAALVRSQRDVTAAAAELNSFAHAVSHDLRTPVRTIVGFGEILQSDFDSLAAAEVRSYVGRIVGATRKLDALIVDLLAYSRLGTADVQVESVELDDLVLTLLHGNESLRPHFSSIQTQCPLGRVMGSRWILQQVLAELFENAIRFRRHDVPLAVRVHSEHTDTHLRLWIEDNGVGVPWVHREKIWQMFESLDPSRGGNGAGLALVRRGVDRLNCDCGVESDGPGARFWVDFPVTADA